MNSQRKYLAFPVFLCRTAIEQVHPLETEAYLGRPSIFMPIFREKKNGTSVNTKSSSIYSAFHSPPPIRPMVEKSRILQQLKEKEIDNLMEECA